MPTVFTHTAPVLAMGIGLNVISRRLLLAAVIMSVVPDMDVIGFKLGIRYADLLGHRGLSHSLVFALACAMLGWLLAPWLKAGRMLSFVVFFMAVATHILLDAATSGGLGVAAFWPFSDERYFLPWRPIRVSPLNLAAFVSERGLAVIVSELLWVWLPCALIAALLRWYARGKCVPAQGKG